MRIAYTIGILFSWDLKEVLLILKDHPDWQRGLYNVPGGKIEGGEGWKNCIARQFKKECAINSNPENWDFIGSILGKEYIVRIFTMVHNPELQGEAKSMTNEEVKWFNLQWLPDNILCNLKWIIPYALNHFIPDNCGSPAEIDITYK